MANLTLTKPAGSNLIPATLHSLPAGDAALVIGDLVRLDVATGRVVKAQATLAASAKVLGVLISKPQSLNAPVTVMQRGLLAADTGISGLALAADVFLSDTLGAIADAAGTVSKKIGTVYPVFGSGATADKLILIDIDL